MAKDGWPHGRILTSGLEFPEGPVALDDGSVLLVEIKRRTLTRVGPDGEKSIAFEPGGGPNGLAIGPDGAVYVANNGGFNFQVIEGLTRTAPGVPQGYAGGWIERIDLDRGERQILYTRCGDHRLTGPNDIVFDRHGGFYFTDLGKNYPRHRDHGGLYYGLADGSLIVEVAYPMVTPNGVGLSPDGKTVYVAETEPGRLWAFDLDEPGVARRSRDPAPHGGRFVCGLPGYQRFDSLALEASGNICVATIVSGCVTVISPSGDVLRQVPTGDPATTNICFGGPDMKTAYITLSGTGQLLVMDWPEPGLSLVHG